MAKTIVLLGKIGTGKSATANILCGDDVFKSKHSSGSVTKDLQKKTFRYGNDDTEFCVVDSPGVFDSYGDEHDLVSSLFNLFEQQEIVINLFLMVFSLQQRFTKEDIETFNIFDEALGDIWSNCGGIVFTHADMFSDGNEIHSYIKEYSDFYQIIQSRFGERIVTIDNNRKDASNRRQVMTFITDCMQNILMPYTKKNLSNKKIKTPLKERQEDETNNQYRKNHEKRVKEDLERDKRKSKLALEETKIQSVAVETKGSETYQLASSDKDTPLQQLSAEKSRSCENCENHPIFKCKDCKKKFCKECNIRHQFDDDTLSHNVKPIKDKNTEKKSTKCTLCNKVLHFTCSCSSCGPMCWRCEMFHGYAYPKHKTSEITFNRAATDDCNMYASWCENYMKCKRMKQFTCVDCKKYYCRKCVKKIEHEDFHLVLDTDGLRLLPTKFGSKIAINQLVKCVIKITEDSTIFKMFFPFGFIHKPGSKEKSSTTKGHFHMTSSAALFHQNVIVSIGDTAEKHYAIVEKLSKDKKMLFELATVSRKPSSKDVELYYKNLLSELKLHWMMELQTILREMHMYLKESAIVMFLVKTSSIAEIHKILREDFIADQLGCLLISEEDVKKFIVVTDDDTNKFEF